MKFAARCDLAKINTRRVGKGDERNRSGFDFRQPDSEN